MAPPLAKDRNLSVLDSLELARLPPEGLNYVEALPAPWVAETIKPLDGAPEETAYQPTGAGHVDLLVMPLGTIESRPPLQLTGRMTAPLEVACVRCLEQVQLEQSQTVDLVVFPDNKEDEEPPESTYEGEKIDLGFVLREQLLLHLDPDPCCTEATACDARTEALLSQVNQPADDVSLKPESPFAALAALKKDD